MEMTSNAYAPADADVAAVVELTAEAVLAACPIAIPQLIRPARQILQIIS
jgi:hypothetical protein